MLQALPLTPTDAIAVTAAPVFSVQLMLPVFAYAKPMPVNPSAMRNAERGMRWYALAGPLANLALTVLFGVGLRATGASSSVGPQVRRPNLSDPSAE